jgi:hypothetical protein
VKKTKQFFLGISAFVLIFWLQSACLFSDGGAAVKSESLGDYIRLTQQEGRLQPTSLDTAIVKFVNKKTGVKVDLIGAVHIADKEYYEALNDEFKKYDAVLFELVVNETDKNGDEKLDKRIFETKKKKNAYSDMQGSFGEFLQLSHQVDHVDYTAKNMVHADLSLQEFLQRVSERGDIFLMLLRAAMMSLQQSEKSASAELETQGRIIGSFFASNPSLSFKRSIARQMTSQLDEAANLLAGESSAIISDRNAAALKVLRKEIKKGTKKIAIFYGSAHLPEFVKSLKKDFKLQETEVTWLVAWDLTKNKTARKK